MKCNKCGSPLPSEGVVCKFCGAMMSPEQIGEKMQAKDRETRRLELLSEKYGRKNTIEYRDEKDNKSATIVAIVLVVLFLVIISVLLFLLKKA